MSTVSKEDILEAVANMSVMDVCELVKSMEEKFGVSAQAAVAVAAPAGEGAAAEVQTEFDVVMKGFGGNKIAVIKVIRAITGLGLKEAKGMVDGVPATVKEAVSESEAKEIADQLTEAGAEVEVK
jgi:large subunit ribosomal protein L7/L12